jgi:hypothetical protein
MKGCESGWLASIYSLSPTLPKGEGVNGTAMKLNED